MMSGANGCWVHVNRYLKAARHIDKMVRKAYMTGAFISGEMEYNSKEVKSEQIKTLLGP